MELSLNKLCLCIERRYPMKTNYKTYILVTLALGAVLSTASAQTAEYDDMYFSPKDRVDKEKKVAKENFKLQKIEESVTIDPEESYSQKNVNPEYLAKYKADQEESDKGQTYAEDEYFNENYNAQAQNGTGVMNDADVVVRDRFGNTTYFRDSRDLMWNDPFMARGAAFDPFWGPSFGWNRFRPGWNVNIGMGWNSWNRWNTGFGIGYGWGNPWGFHDPFFNPWFRGGMGFYDPWFYDPFFCPSPFRNNVVLINNYETRSNRTVRRGVGGSRVATNTNNGTRSRSTPGYTNTPTDRRSSSRVASNQTRYASEGSRTNYSSGSRASRSRSEASQSRFYRRSQSNNNEGTVRQANNSRSSYSNSRNTRSSSNYSRDSRSYRNSSARSRSSNSSYRNNSSRSRSSSYSRPSSTRSSSYSRPSSGSRSRSSSYNSGYRSRSSSYSSPSRSSGRSSGGSRSSSSSRRRN